MNRAISVSSRAGEGARTLHCPQTMIVVNPSSDTCVNMRPVEDGSAPAIRSKVWTTDDGAEGSVVEEPGSSPNPGLHEICREKWIVVFEVSNWHLWVSVVSPGNEESKAYVGHGRRDGL